MKMLTYIKQTHSTNVLLGELIREYDLPEGFAVRTDFQTLGKGQQGNSWESQAGRNLLLSMVLYPHHIAIEKQFIISEIVSLSIKKALDEYTQGISIKWPNDIYWNDKKIAGILIENSLRNGMIFSCIVGIGLNVNQKKFVSNAPNPISLRQIVGKPVSKKLLFEKITRNIMELYTSFDAHNVHKNYLSALYRKDGFYPYREGNKLFKASIVDIATDGKLTLKTKEGLHKVFSFKEVEFVI